jgi:hypothetical protein
MNPTFPVTLSTALCLLLSGCAGAQPPGPTYEATACKIAPRVDGVEAADEWKAAGRQEIEIQMRSAKGAVKPVRKAELRFMNSSGNLYLAFRIPDAARDFSTNPVVADLLVLAFCRGNELAEGDDRRVMLPGLFADKHFVSPGKDADDTQKDGSGAMGWRSVPSGGEYFAEWQIPLNSKDKNDIAAAPGDTLRFNVAYIDRFSPTQLDQVELGGVFGPDAEHVKGWGSLKLAAQVSAEVPAALPAWLGKLFPDTGKPGRLDHRFRRVDAGELAVAGKVGGSAIVELAYPGLDGKEELGQARIFLPPSVRTDPTARVPLIHYAGYELDEAGAIGLAAKGYVVCTPHAHPLNPLSRGVNLDRAILHAVRRLPCVDPLRISIQGGSAGGWMTLMLAADAFPLVWAMPDVPPIHLGYNAAYIGENQGNAGPADKPRLPGLRIVGALAAQMRTLYGMPYDSPTFLAVSPLAHLDTITAPTLALFTTADMLVPIDQVDASLIRPLDPKLFPIGFTTALTDRFPGVNGQRTLLKALPASRFELFPLTSKELPARLGPDGSPQGAAKAMTMPFSKDKVWSIVVIDEGPVDPTDGHFKYHWALDHEPFRAWAEARGVTADQLTAPKLQRLMKRLRGEPWRPLRVRPGGKGAQIAGNQLDYPEAEHADVLLGLRAFAADDARAQRLAQVYAELPAELKVLGARLGPGSAAGVRAALDAVKEPTPGSK